MDESRKQFEEWFKTKYHVSSDVMKIMHIKVEIAWEAWQASRAAIEITEPKFIDSREALSKGFTVDYSNGFGDAMEAYEENIRAAGIKVKE
ncbi:TPA: hypothetical protein ACWZJD_000935 [Escherichia coli]